MVFYVYLLKEILVVENMIMNACGVLGAVCNLVPPRSGITIRDVFLDEILF